MRRINFSDVGVPVNSMEELDEIHMTYTALGITFSDEYSENASEADSRNLGGYYIQSVRGDLKTHLPDPYLYVSIIKYPIMYTMNTLDFAAAYHLLKSNQTEELITHLDKYCKEFK